MDVLAIAFEDSITAPAFFVPFHFPEGSASLRLHLPVKAEKSELNSKTNRPLPFDCVHHPVSVCPLRVPSMRPLDHLYVPVTWSPSICKVISLKSVL